MLTTSLKCGWKMENIPLSQMYSQEINNHSLNTKTQTIALPAQSWFDLSQFTVSFEVYQLNPKKQHVAPCPFLVPEAAW